MSSPVPCPPRSRVVAPDDGESAAATPAECLCLPSYFLFQSVCLPCPTSLLCPFNGTIAPIPCQNEGYTLTEGSRSPTSCHCPPRTYGLACTPCADNMDCSVPLPQRVPLSTLVVDVWGPLATRALLETCVQGSGESGFLLYSTFGTTARSIQRATSAISSSSSSAAFLPWSWLVVLEAGDPGAAAQTLYDCLAPQTLVDAIVPLSPTPTMVLVIKPRLCGLRREWDGDPLLQLCVCVAGYHEADTPVGVECVPCPNGTVRARRSPGFDLTALESWKGYC